MIRTIKIANSPTDNTTRLLWAWFGAGIMALAMFPALREHNQVWGWLPFWCVVAPLIDLAFVQRARLHAMSKALSVRIQRKRRRRAPRQAVARRGHAVRGMRRLQQSNFDYHLH